MRTTARKNTGIALAAVAALALSLTACGGDGDGGEGKASGSSASSDTAGTTSGGTGEGTSGGGAGEGKSGGGSTVAVAPAGDDDCTLSATKIVLQESGGSAPVVLLKLTNNGDKSCSVFGAPFVADPTAGRNLPVAENTRPQSVVRVAPAGSAYASIGLASRDNDKTHRSKTLDVTLATEDGKGTDGHTTVNSPGPAGLLLDDSSQVTYWQSTSEDALS
ncbi:DUF4232 domain-containing protein [Streptomyces sp. NPDC050658]|uniref:DUF4232 domain-containing protein n=1 Tax=unclassified Streptomyces TaxID=2593676 RepID=UPI00344ABA15